MDKPSERMIKLKLKELNKELDKEETNKDFIKWTYLRGVRDALEWLAGVRDNTSGYPQ